MPRIFLSVKEMKQHFKTTVLVAIEYNFNPLPGQYKKRTNLSTHSFNNCEIPFFLFSPLWISS